MKIGLIIAIERELKAFLEHGTKIETIIVSNRTIYKGIINNHEIYAMKSGYGIIDASSATQLLISVFNVELILNFGVTGALDKSLKVSDLFVVKDCVAYGFDVSPIDNVKKCQYEEFDDIYMPLTKSKVDLVHKIYPNIIDATCASGDRFIEDKKDKDYLYSLGCNICDMEIAGIFRVCHICNVEALSIKCISDTYDGDGGDFNTNVINSAKLAFDVILEILNRI